ncbi:MAG TPA: hypothetical protein VGQ48_07970 [Gemmatimonadales bacterium]|nr:hypothetical protein [Gemmatimonadales bacterium]
MINPGMIGVFIPLVAVGGFFAWMISLSPLGKALAERLRHGPTPRGGTGEEHAELVDSVEQLRREVAELAERVDFTERLLGQQQAGGQLGRPHP